MIRSELAGASRHVNPLAEDNGATASVNDSLAPLIGATRRNEVEEVIVDPTGIEPACLSAVVAQQSELPLEIHMCTSAIDLTMSGADAEAFDSGNLTLRTDPMQGWSGVAKQVLDVVVAAIALVLLAPVLVVIALAIKRDSPGPVLFRQTRHGRNEQEFKLLKFRTMRIMEDGDRIEQARRDDPRVTRVGRFLRRTSLDELPQLVNVLRGEMSLVGPRPHAVAHNRQYGALISGYRGRHRVKPGITGLAQISGLRGETRDPELMRQRVETDLQYIDNWSIWLDLRILLLTPILGFVGRNAH
jgi:putative colanic acid biosynthesis UDP-glucose lipid carrier transferase